ncbi:MAG: hypothetical protein ACYDHE_06330 [Candidatus Acidiferrales bacterium]
MARRCGSALAPSCNPRPGDQRQDDREGECDEHASHQTVHEARAHTALDVVDGGTVVRLVLSTDNVSLLSSTVIGHNDGREEAPVSGSVDNRIARIADALQRSTASGGLTVSAGGALNDPLGLTLAPDGDILTVNGGDGNIVETTQAGTQVAVKLLDTTGSPPGNGALFGVAIPADRKGSTSSMTQPTL